MTRVEELNSLADLQPHRLRWRKLLGETRGASFVQSLEWLDTYWRHFGAEGRLRVLIVSSDREPLGIVPLAVRLRHTRLGIVRVLSFMVEDWAGFCGPIGPNPTACLLTALRHIQQTPRDWDLIQLDAVDPTQDCGRTEHALRRVGFPAHRSLGQATALLWFRAPWPAYWASRTEHCRRTLRRAEAHLAMQGSVEYVHYRPQGAAWDDADPRWDLYDACEWLAGQGSPTRTIVGTISLCEQRLRPFLRDLHPRAAQAAMVDLHLLHVSGIPAAFAYGYHLGGQVVAVSSGVHPGPCFRSASTVLLGRLLERCCKLGDLSYNLGGGSLRPKRRWLTDLVHSESYTHFAATPRMQLLRITHRLMRGRAGILPTQGPRR